MSAQSVRLVVLYKINRNLLLQTTLTVSSAGIGNDLLQKKQLNSLTVKPGSQY